MYCPQCQGYYTPKGDWQKTCTKCWITNKEDKIRQEGYQDGFEAGKKSAPPARPERQSPVQISEDMLKIMISLCHPDRHPKERYEQANAATSWLNAFRTHKKR